MNSKTAVDTAAAQHLSDDDWIALAERHASADWNADKPDGFLNAVKELCKDFAHVALAATPAAQPSAEPVAWVQHFDGYPSRLFFFDPADDPRSKAWAEGVRIEMLYRPPAGAGEPTEPSAECGNTPYDEGPFTLAGAGEQQAPREMSRSDALNLLVEHTPYGTEDADRTSCAVSAIMAAFEAGRATPVTAVGGEPSGESEAESQILNAVTDYVDACEANGEDPGPETDAATEASWSSLVSIVRAALAPIPGEPKPQGDEFHIPITLPDGRIAKVRVCDLREDDLVTFMQGEAT
jgi:hypothetical protein